tara:strand:+ start:864 stop:4535 length:3672 start_codon:yes stop_codon:yes gene_type:complete
VAEAIHRVGIEVDIDSANVAARIKAIEKQIKAMEKAVSRLDRRGDGINDRFTKLDKRMGSLGQAVKRVTGLFTKLFTTFAKFSFLAMAGEIAIFTAGLLAVKLALITGRAAASLYNITLKGLSVTAAAVGASLATAAAAMRQFQEAQLSPFLADARSGPNGLNAFGRRSAAGRLGRGIGSTTGGLLGMEGTQQVVAALARAGISGRQGIGLAQGLGNLTNFDPKAMAQIIQALGGAIKTGSISPALSAVQNAVGFRGGSISASSAGGLISQISSGSLTGQAFQGQGDMLSKTLIGTFKTSFVGVRDQFADIGVSLLEPMRESFLEIAQILQRSMLSLQVIIQKFGAESMGPTMVTIFDRMMRFITENIIDHLSKVKEMGESFVGFFRSVRNFFVEMGDFLGRYEPAANVIIDMFKAASGANKSALFRNFSEGLVANADRIKEFGAGIGRLFGGIFSLFESGNQGFFGGLERITNITDSISDELIPALKEFFNAASPIVERIPTVIEGLSSVLSMIAPAIQVLASVISQLIGALSNMPGGSSGIGMLALGAMAMRGGGLGKNIFKRGGASGGFMASGGAAGVGGGTGVFSTVRGTFVRGAGFRANSRNIFDGVMRNFGGLKPGTGPKSQFAVLRGGGIKGAFSNLRGAGPLPLAGLALSTMGAIDFLSTGGGSALDSGKVTAGGVLTGAMLGSGIGAGLGSFFGPAGTLAGLKAGALLGAAFDPVAAGVMDMFGIDSREMKYTKSHHAALRRARNTNIGLSASNSFHTGSRDLYDMQTRSLDLFQNAVDANIRTGKGGDTEAFRQFLTFMGADPNMANRDEYFNRLQQDGFGDEIMGNLKNMEAKETALLTQGMKHANLVLSNFAGTAMQTTEAVANFAKSLGYDVMNMRPGQMAAMSTVMAAQQLQINRDMAITPSMAGSTIQKSYARSTASAALNAIAAGDISPNAINDFINKKAAFEISRGKSADIAALSGILDLFMHGKSRAEGGLGSFGANSAKIMDAGMVMAEDMARQMEAANYGSFEQIMGFINAGNMTGLDRMIQGKADFRDAIGGGNLNMKAGKRLSILKKNGIHVGEQFMSLVDQNLGGNVFSENAYNTFADGGYRNMLGVLSQGTQEGSIDQGNLDQAITKALIDAGLTGNQLETLRSINQKLGLLPDQISKVDLIINSTRMGGTSNTIGATVDGEGAEVIMDIDEAIIDNIENGAGTEILTVNVAERLGTGE